MTPAFLPFADESAASFTIRLARREGLSLQEFCQGYLGLTPSQARSDLDQLLPSTCSKKLSALAGIPEESLYATIIPRAWVRSTWDKKVRRHQALVHVCPVCLDENLYGRRFWRTHFAAICPIHELEMVGFCPHCNAPLSYFSSAENFLVSHWLENWPACQNCLKKITPSRAAKPIVVTMARYWEAAFKGQIMYGLTPREFLELSIRCLRRFESKPQYQEVLGLMDLPTPWAPQQATALLLHAMLHGPVSISVFHAAIGSRFQPASLARELSTAWHMPLSSTGIPKA